MVVMLMMTTTTTEREAYNKKTGRGTWLIRIEAECSMRIFDSMVLSKIFWLGENWRKLHNEKLDDLFSSLNVRWSGQEERTGRELWHPWGRKEMHTALRWEKHRDVDYL